MAKKKINITASTKIGDLLREYPKAKKVMQKHRIACPECGGRDQESLEAAAICHGMDIKTLIMELENESSGKA